MSADYAVANVNTFICLVGLTYSQCQGQFVMVSYVAVNVNILVMYTKKRHVTVNFDSFVTVNKNALSMFILS